MKAAMLWCRAWEEEELSDEVFAERVSELIETPEGARGFFVISLASDCAVLDRLPESLVMQLRKKGEGVVDLVVRNLAMSSAMAIHHERQANSNQQAGSERVIARCIELLRILEPTSVKLRLERLLKATVGEGEGEDVKFLKNHSYDQEQKEAIALNINSIAEG